MAKGGKGGSGAAEQARADEAARQQRVTEGTAAINTKFDSQFTPEYFGGLQRDYLDYAKPQLDDQYDKTQKQLTYALARSGNLDSSTRGDQFSELQKTYDTSKLALADTGLNQANTARNSVESSRAALIANLNASGDSQAAVSAAQNQAAALSAKPGYTPIGDLFAATTGALSTQAQLERNYALTGANKPTYNTGLFGGSGAVKVTN